MSEQHEDQTRDRANADPGTSVSPTHPIFRHPPGFRPRRARNWFFLGLMYASYYLCRYNLGIVAPELKEQLGLDNKKYGAIQSGRDGLYAVGQFVNGLLTDPLGGKRAMTIGAVGTIILNVAFGLVTWSGFTASMMFASLLLVRSLDGYVQAFGAPGMVKINTAWFRKQERGTFAGIFGGMIQLGQIGAGMLGKLLITGSVPVLFFTLTIPETLGWRYIFIVPPVVCAVVVVLMNLMVKNHPEEAGFRIVHDDEAAADDPHQHIRVGEVLRKITSNPIAWINAGAYFCTGFVRTGIMAWWVVYLDEVWNEGKSSPEYARLVTLLPITAFLGSFASGIISDKFFKGRRAPVATCIYLLEACMILLAVLFSAGIIPGATATVMAVLLVGVNITCNSSHSIIGTAAAMDLGGRKMAGFAAGVIDSFQYFGAMLAGFGLGTVLDSYATPALDPAGNPVLDAAGNAVKHINGTAWFLSMFPWAVLGATLMGFLWVAHRHKSTPGT